MSLQRSNKDLNFYVVIVIIIHIIHTDICIQ